MSAMVVSAKVAAANGPVRLSRRRRWCPFAAYRLHVVAFRESVATWRDFKNEEIKVTPWGTSHKRTIDLCLIFQVILPHGRIWKQHLCTVRHRSHCERAAVRRAGQLRRRLVGQPSGCPIAIARKCVTARMGRRTTFSSKESEVVGEFKASKPSSALFQMSRASFRAKIREPAGGAQTPNAMGASARPPPGAAFARPSGEARAATP